MRLVGRASVFLLVDGFFCLFGGGFLVVFFGFFFFSSPPIPYLVFSLQCLARENLFAINLYSP